MLKWRKKTKVANPVIAITMGDPGGIGPEVIVKSLKRYRLNSCCRYVVIGASKVFAFLRKRTGLSFKFEKIPSGEVKLSANKVYFWNIGDGKFNIAKETALNGQMAIQTISIAADLAKQGLVQAIVTAPLNKASARFSQKDFIGHTEFFACKSNTKKYAMMFWGPKMVVTLATIHIPLQKVSKRLTADGIFDKIHLTWETLRNGFGVKWPKLAIAALNPHGRECGDEEETMILPAVCKARRAGIDVSGPFSADLLFREVYQGKYDAVISMYHDQALTAFKLVHFHDGVNVTLGLPYVRTSPDHGTAYDIAYKGKADPSSMIASIRLAEKLVHNRNA